ncbi:DoxX family protein [Hyphobacterium sp.]|jgi:putative oxidoreductase|uniref:DoxX family protein n=1 Tax=Hyphobacterium sp. TaxID=2004662 RepID=UPI003BA8FEC2
MLNPRLRHIDLPARAFLAALFILSGTAKIGATEATAGYMEAFGVPAFLLWPTIIFEIGAGIGVLIGIGTRYLAVLLAGFCLLTALIFHAAFDDQIQRVMFLKNLAMAGGFLLLARESAPAFSIDRLMAARES